MSLPSIVREHKGDVRRSGDHRRSHAGGVREGMSPLHDVHHDGRRVRLFSSDTNAAGGQSIALGDYRGLRRLTPRYAMAAGTRKRWLSLPPSCQVAGSRQDVQMSYLEYMDYELPEERDV